MKSLFSRLTAVCLAVSICANAGAQSICTHEFAVSYGLGSNSAGMAVTVTIIAAIFGAQIDYSYFGPVAGEYFYHVSDLVGVGGVATFATYKDKNAPEATPITCVSILPGVKLDWLRREHFGLYSKACIGGAYVTASSSSSSEEQTSSSSSGSLIFNFQASLLGAEFGGSVRGFAELGWGEQGGIIGGVRFRF